MKTPVTVLLLICFSTSASAHDCFLMAKPYRLKPGERTKIAIHIHDEFPGTHVAWNPQRIKRFHQWWGRTLLDSEIPEPTADSSGVMREIREAGVHLFAVDWAARLIEIQPEAFTNYLKSEGLDHVITARAEKKEEKRPGRERYSRYIKALVAAGEGGGDAYRVMVGQRIELVPLENPYAKSVGDTLRFRLFFRGEPLARALVSATYAGYSKQAHKYAQSIRTDRDGVAAFRLTARGPWLVRTVHMLRAEEGDEVDWESWWASCTFEVR